MTVRSTLRWAGREKAVLQSVAALAGVVRARATATHGIGLALGAVPVRVLVARGLRLLRSRPSRSR
ncbi:MAG: hypothetical protein KatS3mg082_2994 [Nitrospiraceae bacterium]|nr:MAG: hypothetical protein KatS3mg082_2994 [Nitrospiraceae bacterium]